MLSHQETRPFIQTSFFMNKISQVSASVQLNKTYLTHPTFLELQFASQRCIKYQTNNVLQDYLILNITYHYLQNCDELNLHFSIEMEILHMHTYFRCPSSVFSNLCDPKPNIRC